GRVVVVNGKIGDVGTAVGAADGDGVGACRNVADVLRGGAVRPDVGVGRRRTVHRDVDVAVGEVAGGGCGHARNGRAVGVFRDGETADVAARAAGRHGHGVGALHEVAQVLRGGAVVP